MPAKSWAAVFLRGERLRYLHRPRIPPISMVMGMVVNAVHHHADCAAVFARKGKRGVIGR